MQDCSFVPSLPWEAAAFDILSKLAVAAPLHAVSPLILVRKLMVLQGITAKDGGRAGRHHPEFF